MQKKIEISERTAEMIRTDEAYLSLRIERDGYRVREATKEIEGRFSFGERRLMAHAAETARFDLRLDPVETLVNIIQHEARMEDLDTFYKVDLASLLDTVKGLTRDQADAIVEILAIVQLPHVGRDRDEIWTVAGRKIVLAPKKRLKRPPQDTERATAEKAVTQPGEEAPAPASINGSVPLGAAESA